MPYSKLHICYSPWSVDVTPPGPCVLVLGANMRPTSKFFKIIYGSHLGARWSPMYLWMLSAIFNSVNLGISGRLNALHSRNHVSCQPLHASKYRIPHCNNGEVWSACVNYIIIKRIDVGPCVKAKTECTKLAAGGAKENWSACRSLNTGHNKKYISSEIRLVAKGEGTGVVTPEHSCPSIENLKLPLLEYI